jgi:hypothetical protein
MEVMRLGRRQRQDRDLETMVFDMTVVGFRQDKWSHGNAAGIKK